MSIEDAVRTLIKDLGTLPVAQQVTAAQAVTVAASLDQERDGTKAAALSRELRQLTTQLMTAAGSGKAKGDAVARGRDEVARKRAERAKRATG